MMNLALKPASERIAIEQDKQLWFKANKLLRNHNRSYIRQYLDGLDESDRTDMARRLNKIKGNK